MVTTSTATIAGTGDVSRPLLPTVAWAVVGGRGYRNAAEMGDIGD